ncbi:ROK family protein [Acetonema longum]|nr:ROK family protein [Acetonema longum]
MRVKQVNVELVKTALKALKIGTKSTIANATGLSVATCGNILNELLGRGEVIETDLEESSGGRPAKRFIYNANYAYIACIYVSNEGGTYRVVYAIANLTGEIIERNSSEAESINYEAIDKLIENLTGKYANIKAVGIGIPGIVHKGLIGAGDIEELVDIPLAARLKAKYNLQITVENDVNLTAYGFCQKQRYEEDKTVAVVMFPEGNCSGAGIVIDGRIIRGNTSFAGEVSYLPLNYSQEEQIRQTKNPDVFFSLMVKTIISIIAVINPAIIAVTGGLTRLDTRLDTMEGIARSCEAIIPREHMPQIIIKENMQEDCIHGLISITLESMACDIQLIEKRL